MAKAATRGKRQSDLAIILNALGEPAFVIDAERTILLANEAAAALFGKQAAGQDFVRILRHPDGLAAIDKVLRGADKAKAVLPVELPAKVVFELTVASLGKRRAANGTDSRARAMISLADISHVREAEQMRSDFVANVSHELRSPLTALAGFIETLRGPARDDAEARERFLDLMDHEAKRMVRLIADLLSLSKVEVNARIRPVGEADIATIIARVITSLSEQAAKERKTIEVNMPQSLAPIPGSTDELTQVFQNLIENAIKYGAADSVITVTAQLRESAAGFRGPVVATEVRDEGAGIAPEHLPRLTERFYRVDTSRSRDKGGTGLGLAITKHIINRHRGRLQIASEVGVGSRFTVVLPAVRNGR